MNFDQIIGRIPLWFKEGRSILLRSAPGRGKTTTIRRAPELVKAKLGLNIGLVVVNGANLTPSDSIGFGLPKHFDDHSEMIFSDPFFYRNHEGKRIVDYPEGGIVFVDEEDKMDTDVKKVIGEAADSNSRRLGPHLLPPGWVVWFAGNRVQDRSGSTKQLDHLIRRRREIDVTDDLASFDRWCLENDVRPSTRLFAQQHPEIVFAEGVPEKQGPWCTPATLIAVDKHHRLLEEEFGEIPDDEVSMEETAGDIGQAATAALFNFVRLEREMPKYETILANPTKVKTPEKPDAQMLICYNLAHRVKAEEMDPVVEYIRRLPKEFASTFARSAAIRLPSLVMTPAIQKWARENSSLMSAIAAAGR
jgi:hypothetical protein